MKFYLDHTPSHEVSRGEECNGECKDCAPQLASPLPDIFPLTHEEIRSVLSMTLQHASSVYKEPLSDERWLLCNPLGPGHVVVIDPDALELFSRFDHPHMLSDLHRITQQPSPNLLSSLALFVKLGLLVDTNSKISPPSFEENTSTLTAWLHVTNSCNLRCSYCYIDKTQENMSAATAHQSIDAIFRSAARHAFKHVNLKYAGGEASLQLSHVIEMHDYALQLAEKQHIAMRACILSNGVYLSQHAMDDLKKRSIGITLSLDGIGMYQDRQRSFRNGFGSFAYVDRTIQKLLHNSITPSISITVSQRNIAGLPALISYLLDLDLPFMFNYYRENPASAHLQDLLFSEQQMIQGMQAVFSLIEQRLPRRRLLEAVLDKANLARPHQYTCGVGHNYLVIDQRGGITKCQTRMQQTITTIEADDPLQSIRDDRTGILNLAVEEKEGCQSCLWRYWCTGGCPALTYQMTGRYDVKSPNCNIYQALFPSALRLEAQRLLTYEPPLSFELSHDVMLGIRYG